MLRILQVGYEAGARVGYENLNGSTQSEAAIAPSRSTGSTWPAVAIEIAGSRALTTDE